MREFLESAANQNHPLRLLDKFLKSQNKLEETGKYEDNWRFVGYVLEIGFGELTIITSDPLKLQLVVFHVIHF